MTDLPRRSYPLVMAPPGGFEDAVKRGRRHRRRKAGGSTGAALAIAGVLAWSTLGSPGGTNGLQPASNVPHTGRDGHTVASASASPSPSASPTAAPPSATGSPVTPRGTGAPTGYVAPPPPTSGPVATTRPTRDSSNPPAAYAERASIEQNMQYAGTSTECPPELGRAWCSYGRVDVLEGAAGTTYTLRYTLCRGVDSGPGTITYDRKATVQFTATDTAHNDRVWTYTLGQPRGAAAADTTVDPGNCVEWTTVWDGYDDFGYTPPQGEYRMDARSTGRSDATLDAAAATFTHS